MALTTRTRTALRQECIVLKRASGEAMSAAKSSAGEAMHSIETAVAIPTAASAARSLVRKSRKRTRRGAEGAEAALLAQLAHCYAEAFGTQPSSAKGGCFAAAVGCI